MDTHWVDLRAEQMVEKRAEWKGAMRVVRMAEMKEKQSADQTAGQ
jgi:hypothetical protein